MEDKHTVVWKHGFAILCLHIAPTFLIKVPQVLTNEYEEILENLSSDTVLMDRFSFSPLKKSYTVRKSP